MTVVLPSVSTAGSRRITARRRAIRATPMASVIVTAAGQPLRDGADRQRDRGGEHLDRVLPPQQDPDGEGDRGQTRGCRRSAIVLNPASFCVSGVASVSAAPTSRWISPSSVSAPVATTIPAPLPVVTRVPE